MYAFVTSCCGVVSAGGGNAAVNCGDWCDDIESAATPAQQSSSSCWW